MQNNSSLRKTTLISYLAVFINAMIGILFTPYIIRCLGDSQYGLYGICSSLLGFFTMDFGLGAAASRFLSKYHAAGDLEKETNTLETIFRLYIYIDFIIFFLLVVVFINIDRIYKALSPNELEQLKTIFVISAFFSVFCFPYQLYNGILTTYEKYIHIKIADIISKAFLVVALLIALSFNLGLFALVTINGIATLISVIYRAIIVKTLTSVKLSLKKYDSSISNEIIRFSLWITVMAISHRLIFSVVPSILGIVSNSTEAAHFNVVLTIENYLYLISTAFSGMFMPTISKIYTSNNHGNDLLNLVIKVGKLIFGINILIFIGLVFLGGDFLGLWAGPGYNEVHIGLLMVVFPSMFYNSMEVLNTAVMVKNQVKYAGLINLLCGVLNIGLCFITSKLFGANGACLSIMIATLIRTIMTFVLFHNVLSISIGVVIKEVFIKTLPVAIIASFFCAIGNSLITMTGWASFVMRGVALVIGAFIGVLLFMRKDFFSMIKR